MTKLQATLLMTLLMVLCTNLKAQEVIQNVQGRESLSLNGRWNFIIDPYQMGYLDYRQEPFDQSKTGKGGFFDNLTQVKKTDRVEYDFNQSPTLKVPGDWNSQQENLQLYEGTVWYKRDFHVTKGKSKRYFIHFGAVNYEAHVYLNGQKLGIHRGGFTPFQYEVTDKILNGDNFLVLMVDNSRKRDEVPTVNTDWWNYGGITRDVTLITTPESYIKDYKIQLSPIDKNSLEGYIQLNTPNKLDDITLEIPKLSIKKNFKPDNNGRIRYKIPVDKIKLWSPQTPYLYTVKLSTKYDTITDKIGFRTIKTSGKDILLNGTSIFLKGISIHDENPIVEGRLRGEGDMRMMLEWAKELGCNFVRLAHYTHNEAMVRLADELGLMVWAEIPVYWTISWDNQDTYNNAQNQLQVGIQRDKNRASVIVWSVGNETPVTPSRNIFMNNLVSKVRELDDTRLVAAALEVEREGYTVTVNDPLGDKIDLASFNEYGGWYWGNPEELPKYTFNIKYDKPVLITEFGAGALGGFHGEETTVWTEEHQAMIYRNQLEMLEKIDGLRGMTPWILADFKSPRRQHPVYQNFWNRKGLISETGAKKKAFYILQEYYSSKN